MGQNFGTATVIEDEATVFEELDLIAKINQYDDGQMHLTIIAHITMGIKK